MKTERIIALFAIAALWGCRREIAVERTSSEQLKEVGQVTLKEAGDSVLTAISSVSINPRGDKVLIVDAQQGIAAIFSISDGSMLRYLRCGYDITDSLARSDASHYINGKYVTLDEIKSIHPEIANQIFNVYTSGAFESDSVFDLSGKVCGILQTGESKVSKWIIEPRMFFKRTSKSSNELFYPQESPGSTCFAQKGIFLYDRHRDSYILSVADYQAIREGHYSRAPTLALFKRNGNRIAILDYLPNEAKMASLGYNFLQATAAVDSNGEVAVSYGLTPTVTKLKSQVHFNLDGLTNLNSKFFYSMQGTSSAPQASLVDFCVQSVEISNRGNYEIVVKLGLNDSAKWEAFEYAPDGQLLHKAIFPLNANLGKIRSLSYHSGAKSFVCLSISKSQQWLLTTFKWVP